MNFRSASPEGSPTAAPLQPFLQMLTDFFDIDHATTPAKSVGKIANRLESSVPALVDREPEFRRILSLSPTAAGRSDPESEQVAIQVISSLFSELASIKPRAVLIDDWQWADNASRQVLANLVRNLAGKPILIVITSRELDQSDPAIVNS